MILNHYHNSAITVKCRLQATHTIGNSLHLPTTSGCPICTLGSVCSNEICVTHKMALLYHHATIFLDQYTSFSVLDLFNQSLINFILSGSVFLFIFLNQRWTFSATRNDVNLGWKIQISFSHYERLEAGGCWGALSNSVMSECHLPSFLRIFPDFFHHSHKIFVSNPEISFLFKAERRKKGEAAGQLHLFLSS